MTSKEPHSCSLAICATGIQNIIVYILVNFLSSSIATGGSMLSIIGTEMYCVSGCHSPTEPFWATMHVAVTSKNDSNAEATGKWIKCRHKALCCNVLFLIGTLQIEVGRPPVRDASPEEEVKLEK